VVGVEIVILMSQYFFDLKRLHVMKNQALILKQLKRDQIRYSRNQTNIHFKKLSYFYLKMVLLQKNRIEITYTGCSHNAIFVFLEIVTLLLSDFHISE
jgi:hypothetical protein